MVFRLTTLHCAGKINGNHTSVLDLETPHILLCGQMKITILDGFQTHYVTFCVQMEITVSDLLSDSLHHVMCANGDHNFRLAFRLTA